MPTVDEAGWRRCGYAPHHLNGIASDNRPENLVLVPIKQNGCREYQRNPEDAVIDDIDALVREQPGELEDCLLCGHKWHGLPLTKDAVYYHDVGYAVPEDALGDDSEIICPGPFAVAEDAGR